MYETFVFLYFLCFLKSNKYERNEIVSRPTDLHFIFQKNFSRT